jgi:hypothetical protein
VRRIGWAVLGGLILGIGVSFSAVTLWLPGPRAAIPTTSIATPSNIAAATPSATRTPVGLPDPKRTPGSINPNVTEDNLAITICQVGWTASIRPPSAYTSTLKLVQIVEYGYSDRSPSHYQEDHLVPLELGGSVRDPTNLWPEPNDIVLADGTEVGSDAKDNLENALRRRVCAGTMQLGDAQRLIAGDWIAAWTDAGRP